MEDSRKRWAKQKKSVNLKKKKKKWKMRNRVKNKYLNWKKKIKRNVKIDWKEKETLPRKRNNK